MPDPKAPKLHHHNFQVSKKNKQRQSKDPDAANNNNNKAGNDKSQLARVLRLIRSNSRLLDTGAIRTNPLKFE